MTGSCASNDVIVEYELTDGETMVVWPAEQVSCVARDYAMAEEKWRIDNGREPRFGDMVCWKCGASVRLLWIDLLDVILGSGQPVCLQCDPDAEKSSGVTVLRVSDEK